jgi:dTDP-4-dehydrorhamnose reductase
MKKRHLALCGQGVRSKDLTPSFENTFSKVIAIIGANGQLGCDLVKVFKNSKNEIVPLTHADIDVTNFELSEKVLKNIQPDVIINCAAYVRVDDAEDNADIAFGVNAIGAMNIAKICARLNSTLMHVSTDYVFDGRKKKPYTEDDFPNPINVYGNSKLAGEYFVRNMPERYFIIRSSSLFGAAGASGKGGNFVETMIKKVHNGEMIRVVDDMVMSPTYTMDAAGMMQDILMKELPFGIYHVANSGYCSWFDFAKTIFEMLGIDGKLLPIKTSALGSKAKRPMFSALASDRLREYGPKMPGWEDGLREYLNEKGYFEP